MTCPSHRAPRGTADAKALLSRGLASPTRHRSLPTRSRPTTYTGLMNTQRANPTVSAGKPVLKSLREQVYDYLFDQLRTKTLDPDTFLDLDAICQRLGVSRTPLRDALIYLEVEGYVELLPRRGVRVRPLSLAEVKNLYQVIGALECTALLEASAIFTPADLKALEDLTSAYRNALDQESFDGVLEMNYKFHDYFLDRCGNPQLADLVRAHKRRLYDWPRRSKYAKEWEWKSLAEHERIVALLNAGDRAGAAEVLKDVHWSFPAQAPFVEPFYRETEA
jgi:DNA-binding GntR family transcriptional regulator